MQESRALQLLPPESRIPNPESRIPPIPNPQSPIPNPQSPPLSYPDRPDPPAPPCPSTRTCVTWNPASTPIWRGG
ncbi:hypothetical protein XarbCFBP7604_16555 [Xanthomonas arboricola]|nr:hypothetical protein XarbCFBP7604_16555 [Xanthomonas arboricola]